ncbi:MAG: DUF3124 domain-containing protein [Syntrophobacteraceae bacterium]|nr:DUF3124 domain-containing protein [Syntrophobacteraceae bacterium]
MSGILRLFGKGIGWSTLFLVVFLPSGASGESEVRLSKGQTIYVPSYSFVYYGDRGRMLNVTVTLNVRNTDPSHPVDLLSVNYYDTKGRLVINYLPAQVSLGPFESVHYQVDESDIRGGSAPFFVVKWKSDKKVNVPVVEAVIIGAASMQGISFVSPGREIIENGTK